MGLSNLVADTIRLPLSVVEDVGNIVRGDEVDEVRKNLEDIIDDITS